MNNKKIQMTEKGYKKCEEELLKLHREVRPKIIKELRIAYEFGDLRENSEFDAAKDAERLCNERIKLLEKMLNNAVISEKEENNNVIVGSHVTIEYLQENTMDTFEIVSPIEASPIKNKISYQSPLGNKLYNKNVNDIVTIESPSGNYKVKIISIK